MLGISIIPSNFSKNSKQSPSKKKLFKMEVESIKAADLLTIDSLQRVFIKDKLKSIKEKFKNC